MQPGDKVRLVCNPEIILTVKRISPHVEMIEVEECAGWGWAYGYVPADIENKECAYLTGVCISKPGEADLPRESFEDFKKPYDDFIDEQLKFLGM
jgi:hypothetical protein